MVVKNQRSKLDGWVSQMSCNFYQGGPMAKRHLSCFAPPVSWWSRLKQLADLFRHTMGIGSTAKTLRASLSTTESQSETGLCCCRRAWRTGMMGGG